MTLSPMSSACRLLVYMFLTNSLDKKAQNRNNGGHEQSVEMGITTAVQRLPTGEKRNFKLN